MFALFLFTLGSFLCGLAWDIESLIAFRVLQGAAGGMLTPVGTAMLFRAFPPAERAVASAVLSIPIVVAPGLLLAGAGLACVMYALAEAGSRGLDDGRVALFGTAGLALLAVFTLVELRAAEPMIDVRLFRDH